MILWLPLLLDKMSAVPVIAPAYLKPIRRDVKQKEYKQKKFFFPFQVKPFISDKKSPDLLV